MSVFAKTAEFDTNLCSKSEYNTINKMKTSPQKLKSSLLAS